MNDTPRTDANARYINGFADQWVPRYVSEDLERGLKGAQAQRDRLAEALRKCLEDSVREQRRMEDLGYIYAAKESQANIDRAYAALQYLNPAT